MKKILLLFLLTVSINSFSQAPLWLTDNTVDTNFDKKVYMFKTLEDYKSDKGEYVGEYVVNTWSDLTGGNTLYFMSNGKEESLNLKKYFGFKVGVFSFIMNKKSPKIPMKIIKEKEKVFYIDGEIYFRMIFDKSNKGYTSRTKEPIYYSDVIGSPLIVIQDIINNEKDNLKLKEFLKCIENADDSPNFRDAFDAYFKCINSF